MWQLGDSSWLAVDCSDVGVDRAVDRVARAVSLKPSSLPVPLSVKVPAGLAVALIDIRLPAAQPPMGKMYLGRLGDEFSPDTEFEVDLVASDYQPTPTGEPKVIAGRTVLVSREPKAPAVWVRAGTRWIYVGASTSDTGPYPDRSAELPLLEQLAGTVTAAPDLSDPKTWFSADQVFG